ncbi:hypothetical protein C8Q74DRAFT_882904 [Fomes fomentarius]|nr:hypothetical protein C8Q74DRAFT_882904 [Fomes fomentarius]
MIFQYRELYLDRWQGGQGKVMNAHTRLYTDKIHWKSAALRGWLTTVTDYHHPPKHVSLDWWERWANPDFLDDFWGTFLATHHLECDDRVVHDHPLSKGACGGYTSSVDGSSTEALSRG